MGYLIHDKLSTWQEQTDFVAQVPVLQNKSEQAKNLTTFDLPEIIDFAGEKVPLDDPEVKERLDRELHLNSYFHSSTIAIIKKANRWLPQIEGELKKEGLPSDLKYLALIESGLDNVVSPAGATGFWQLRDITAKELGLEVNEQVDQRYDPLHSTRAAAAYLKKAYQRFGSWTNAAASYNMGIYGLGKRLEEQKMVSYYDLLLNYETSRYIFRVLAIKEIMENPEKYGYQIPEKHLYEQETLRPVLVDKSISNLVDFALQQGINYKILKQYNPWLRTKSLDIARPGQTYTILVPEKPPFFQIANGQVKELPPSLTSSNDGVIAE